MQIHLFGARTAAGESFYRHALAQDLNIPIFCYSRQSVSSANLTFVDFCDSDSFVPAGDLDQDCVWVSFAPIWLFSRFLLRLYESDSPYLKNLRGLVICSSSSVISKRFSFNKSDIALSSSLLSSESTVINIASSLGCSCQILRPSMIYGCVDQYVDKNLHFLLSLMRRTPFLIFPSRSGMRQPIHASQLAEVVMKFSLEFMRAHTSTFRQPICLGGDSTITYLAMLRLFRDSQPLSDPCRRCKFLLVPNRLFFFLSSPLLLVSPKVYEAILRLGSNLSDYSACCQILDCDPCPFPVASHANDV